MKCLVAVHNAAAARTKLSECDEDSEGGSTDLHYARAFAELLAFIEETLANTEEYTPVFKLSDLRLYKERLVQLSVTAPSVYSTRSTEAGIEPKSLEDWCKQNSLPMLNFGLLSCSCNFLL